MNRYTGLILLLVLTLGSAWLLHKLSLEDRRRAPGRGHQVDYYMERFTRTSTDASGRISDRLRAERMVHYSDDNSTELVRPELEFYNGDERPWQARSDRGWVSGDGDVVILLGQVDAWRNAADGSREIELVTRDLRVLVDEKLAESEAHSTIRNATTVAEADGMRADFGRNKLELMTHVRSRYRDSDTH